MQQQYSNLPTPTVHCTTLRGFTCDVSTVQCVCGIDRVQIYRNDVYHNAHNTIVYSRSSLLHSNISMHCLCSEACSCEACIAKAVLLPSTVATAILVSAQFESGCLNNRSVPPLVSF